MSRDRHSNASVKAEPLLRWTDPLLLPVWGSRAVLYRVAPLPVLVRLATLRGDLVASMRTRRAKRTLRQLRAVYAGQKSEADIRAIYRRSLRHRALKRMIPLWLQSGAPAFLGGCPAQGIEHLDGALAKGRGAILLTIHFGYGRLIKPLLTSRGYQVSNVGRVSDPDEDDRLSRFAAFVNSRMLRAPSADIAVQNDLPTGLNLRPVLAALQRNEAIVLTADGFNASRFVQATVLGRALPLATGSMSIAAATGAAVLPTFVVDTESARAPVKLVIEAPLALVRSNDPENDLLTNLQAYADVVAAKIDESPHLFAWKRLRRTARALNRGAADSISGRYLRRQAASATAQASAGLADES
jgi:KDO2-lipid IV(A) lauroyltransferase